MRLFPLIVLAACAPPIADSPPAPAAAGDVEPVEPEVAYAALVDAPQAPSHRQLFHVELAPLAPPPHATAAIPASIAVLAVTEDGRAAATADSAGNVRLWPTLDGTREPVVVIARRPVNLAIARDGSEIVLGALDELGQLELVRLTADGIETERIAVPSPRAIVELVATSHGLVARRDDQVLAWIDLHGSERSELSPPIGERVIELAGRHGRILAIVEGARVRRGRWLELDAEHMAWGDTTPRLKIMDGAALAPGGTQLLARNASGDTVIVDLRRGHTIAIGAAPLTPLGFIDDDTVLVRDENVVDRWDRHGGTTTNVTSIGSLPTAVTDRGLVSASPPTLELLAADGSKRWLGYQMGSITDMVPARHGWVATDGLSVVHLDAHFRADRVYAPGPEGTDLEATFTLVDDRHVVSSYEDKHALYDLEDADVDPEPLAREGTDFAYNRASRIAVMRGQTQAEFSRYDPVAHAFGPPIGVWTHDNHTWATSLVDPALAHGLFAVDLQLAPSDPQGNVRVAVAELRSSRVEPVAAARTRVVQISEDRSFTNGEGNPLGAFAIAMPHFPQARRTSPDGAFVAELDRERLTVRAIGGAARWSRAAPGAIGVYWTARGDLVLYGNGVARADGITGALLERQCGWRFGLWDEEPTRIATAAALCDAP